MTNNQDELLKMASQKLGISKDTIKNATDKNGENLLNKLSKEDKEKVSAVLSDPEMTKKVLSSKKAQELLKNFFGDR